MLIDIVKGALRNLRRKRIRTLLTMLGISVGVASVVVISAIGQYGALSVNRELDCLGLSGITVSSSDELQPLGQDDLNTILSVRGVSGAMPLMSSNTLVHTQATEKAAVMWGIAQGEQQVISLDIVHGRPFSAAQVEHCEPCCLLDSRLALALFGRENVLGKSVDLQIGGTVERFEVVGIAKTESGIVQSVMGDMLPEFVYIPYTVMNSLSGNSSLAQIAVSVNGEELSGVGEQIKSLLSIERGADTVKIDNLSAQRERLNDLLSIITMVLSAIGSISLLVSGLSIMTVMLVSVNERTREIGVKKAIGADERSIMLEFFTEALTISALGSIIGAVLGAALAALIGVFTGEFVPPQSGALLFAVLSAVTVGGLFGLFPAIKAARLRPIDALRGE